MRKLATIRKIDNLLPIEGADLIVTAVIDGWTVVVKKDEFKIGDLCVYFEIDSFLPDGNPAWQHLVEKHPRMFEGKRGHRLKTVRLRGQLSQGFAAPVNSFIDAFIDSKEDEGQELSEYFFVGNDLSDLLGIVKYEAPIPTALAGQISGNFPSFIPKTDQERCQNIGHEIFVDNKDSSYEITMKVDGTSFTAYYKDGVTGVCGRNWDLSLDELNAGNSLVRMFIDSGLQEALHKYGENIAIQGELYGVGIQGNKEGINSRKLAIFDMYDIENQCYFPSLTRRSILDELYELGLNKELVHHIPIIGTYLTLDKIGACEMKSLLEYSKGPSLHAAMREGLVFKRIDGKFSFKVINNDWLLKNE